MTTDELKMYRATIRIKAACEADARELIEDYLGNETDVEVEKIIMDDGWMKKVI